jgi:hypothetical protein
MRRYLAWILVGAAVLSLGACLVVGAGGYFLFRSKSGAKAEEGSATKADLEELVKQYILNHAKDPKQVEFLKWGPHMTRAEWDALLDEGGVEAKHYLRRSDFDHIIRVVYRAPKPHLEVAVLELNDSLIAIKGKTITGLPAAVGLWSGKSRENREVYDEWKKDTRRNLARSFPAIKNPD